MLTRKHSLSIAFTTCTFLFVLFIVPVFPHSTSIGNSSTSDREFWIGLNRQNIENWNGIGNAMLESCGLNFDFIMNSDSKISVIPCVSRINTGMSSVKISSFETSLSPGTLLRYTLSDTVPKINIGGFIRTGLGLIYEELPTNEELTPDNASNRFLTVPFQIGSGIFYDLKMGSIGLKPFCSGYFEKGVNIPAFVGKFSHQAPQFSTEVGLEIRYDSNRGVFMTWKHSLDNPSNTFYVGVLAYQK